jgi:ubiquinone/menaquinone biosynthesis C-methylase UbiE
MKIILLICFAIAFLIILASYIWRLFSRRASLPCPAYLSFLVERDNPFTKTNRAKTIIEHLNISPGMKILDAGCGPGRLTIPMAKKTGTNGQITALDIQEKMLSKTKNKADLENLKNINYLRANLGDNKLQKNYFDRAILVTVLGEIPNKEKALQEIYDSLKPDGILSITEVIFDPHFLFQKKVITLAEKIGFQKINIFGNKIAYTILFSKQKSGN